ncbi:MAG: hypothetical protein IJ447_00860 [Clostridia bacterium]|nr:hypothetical protein [Clostridia bacterium]
MASRIMHLAIADRIFENVEINEKSRFNFGTILPDAYREGENIAVSHFKIRILNNTKLTYDLTEFRNKYKEKLVSDDLYLGYYIHLVEDLFFRDFVYDKHHWDPMPKGNVQRLHNDYKLLNTYLIEKHRLLNNISIPCEIKEESIFEIYPFDINNLVKELKTDFQFYNDGKIFFFTKEMADEFIENTAVKCVNEIKAIRAGKTSINENEFAWNVHK